MGAVDPAMNRLGYFLASLRDESETETANIDRGYGFKTPPEAVKENRRNVERSKTRCVVVSNLRSEKVGEDRSIIGIG